MPIKCFDTKGARGSVPNLKVTGHGCGSAQNKPKQHVYPISTKQETKDKRPNLAKDLAKRILDEQYAKSLEQQIKLLEFENQFLRDRGESHENRCARYGGKQILLRNENEVSLDGGNSWCRLPSFHPPLHHFMRRDCPTAFDYDEKRGDDENKNHPTNRRDRSSSPELNEKDFNKFEEMQDKELSRSWDIKRRPSTIHESDEEDETRKSPKVNPSKNDSKQRPTLSNPRSGRVGPVKQASVSRIDEIKRSIEKRRENLTNQINSVGGRRQSMPTIQPRSFSIPRKGDEAKMSSQKPSRQSSVHRHLMNENGSTKHQQEEKDELIQELEGELDFLNAEVQDRERKIAQFREKLKANEEKLNNKTANDSRDRRALMEELLELQRRLDELTPILAEKEAHIAKLENERDAATTSMRAREGEIRKLQTELSEKHQEQTFMSDRETNHKEEMKRLEATIARLEEKEMNLKTELRTLTEELLNCKKHGSELEMRLEREKNLVEQLTDEHSRLIGKNADLSSDMQKLELAVTTALSEAEEITKNIVKRDDYDKVKSSESSLRIELEASIERNKSLQLQIQQLEKQISDQEDSSSDYRESRERIQREFNALQALSRSLTEENKTLREEILDLRDKLEQQRNKLKEKDSKIFDLEDELGRIVKVHQETVHKVEKETRTQIERGLELEDVTRRLKEIADSLPRTEAGSIASRSHRPSFSREESITSQQSSVRRGTRVIPLMLDECHSPQSPHDIQKIIEMARNTLKRPL
ncbi:unnamed protein product, partial [Mesorhabditis belari]|uniref:Uncharacterized protein n=1 Tax=Mesorhabditis belari TaxID=2138241 RepID=A0AAF3FAT1_9BILA